MGCKEEIILKRIQTVKKSNFLWSISQRKYKALLICNRYILNKCRFCPYLQVYIPIPNTYVKFPIPKNLLQQGFLITDFKKLSDVFFSNVENRKKEKQVDGKNIIWLNTFAYLRQQQEWKKNLSVSIWSVLKLLVNIYIQSYITDSKTNTIIICDVLPTLLIIYF